MDDIDRIRAFNRTYTKQIGVLSGSYLGSGLSLTEVRVLHDIDTGENGCTAGAISEALGLDEGYVSRLVKRFEAQGWLTRRPDPNDARRRQLALTPSGAARLAPLREASRAGIAAKIDRLPPSARNQLLQAIEQVERLFLAETDHRLIPSLRGMQPGDAGWIVQRHAELYAQEYGFDGRFEGVVARIMADFLDHHDPTCERGWIAQTPGGVRLGSILCARHDATTAKLRVLLVEPSARGYGVGRTLVSACVAYARASGYSGMTLWTQKSLAAACALYAEHGFRIVDERAEHDFGQSVVNQTWEIRF